MTIIERLDETILQASESGALIEVIDLTDDDYAELMAFASRFDDDMLSHMSLDMHAQTYRHCVLNFGSRVSHAELETGENVRVPEPTDDPSA